MEGEIVAHMDPEYPKFGVGLLRQWETGFEEGWCNYLLFNNFHDPRDVLVVKKLERA